MQTVTTEQNKPYCMNDHNIFGYCVLFSIFIGSYVIAPLLATKIITVGPFYIAAGILVYSVTFPITDIITEVYGEKHAKHVVFCGFIGMLVAFLLTQMVMVWPEAPFWKNQEAFQDIFGTSGRIFIGSMTAYLVSQNLDVYIFAKIRKKMGKKRLWFRNNISTAISKFVDVVLFFTIAFYGIYNNQELITIIVNGWVVHLMIAIADTPLVYLGIWIIRKAYPEFIVRSLSKNS